MSNGDIIEKIKKQVEEHEKRISELEALYKTEPEAIAPKPSIKDFIRSKKPQDDLQKTLATGRYLEEYEGFPCFNVKDLEKGFRDAKEPVPSNINDKANKNEDKNYVMQAKEKKDGLKAWNLTAKGEEYVDSGFQERE